MHKSDYLSRLISGAAYTLLLSAASSLSYGAGPYRVLPPSGKKWTMTFDDEFTKDKSIDRNKWNGGAGGTDWCGLEYKPNQTDPGASQSFKGKSEGCYMFRECSDLCRQHYDGLTFSSANGLEMRSPGYPSSAIQTGGTTAQNAKFIQKYGYWEARIKQPTSANGQGTGIHSDFWMHPIPEGVGNPTDWLPEIDVGERPVWKADLESANNRMYFGIHDYGHDYDNYFGTSPLTDLSRDWHTYGLYWRDDGSGPYGSMQFYLDGVPLGSPYTLSARATNMANGVYIFFSLDNDSTGGKSSNPFLIQYVRVWRLDPNSSSGHRVARRERVSIKDNPIGSGSDGSSRTVASR